VKGKTIGLNIFTPLKTDPNSMAEYLSAREIHDLMIDYYREQNWDQALHMIDQLKGEFDSHMDHYYDIMIERIGELRESNLPNDWDGVYRATSK
jgi:adenylate cyclase